MKLGVIMDPIDGITIKKDSTFAMLLAAQSRDWELYYMEQSDLFIKDNKAMANCRTISVQDNNVEWYQIHRSLAAQLSDLDVIFMRLDPPFNIEYIYTTYILDLAKSEGTFIVNDPAGLRNTNEKMFTTIFPQCIPPTLVSGNPNLIKAFISENEEVVLKPLHSMGGRSIFKIKNGDLNTNVIIETLTSYYTQFVMAQKFIPEITEGDKRILLINGKPVKYALARSPMAGETRGNLAAGGTGKGVELSDKDRWICDQVGSSMKERGLLFVGLDIIGDYLTEINVTSPTCIRELDSIYNIDIAGDLIRTIESIIPSRRDVKYPSG